MRKKTEKHLAVISNNCLQFVYNSDNIYFKKHKLNFSNIKVNFTVH
jgi:hypothetical protein